jgi:hypothetical protein
LSTFSACPTHLPAEIALLLLLLPGCGKAMLVRLLNTCISITCLLSSLLLLLLLLLLQLPGCGKALAGEEQYARRFSFCKEHLMAVEIQFGGMACRCASIAL